MYKNAMLGFILGDTMGMPVEFKERETLINNPITKMEENNYDDVPKGAWTDDTSMTLATMDSLIEKKEINQDDLLKKFTEWVKEAKYTSSKKVFDIGMTTARAISNYELENDPKTCGGRDLYDNGNGSLMRMLPIAYYCYINKYTEEEILDAVKKASEVTHAHEISILGCYIYVRYVIFLLSHKDKYASYSMVKCVDYSIFSEDARNEFENILKGNIYKESIDDIKSDGYIKSTLESVLWIILNCENFKQSIIGAINLGGDTDTIGALVGSLAGLIYDEIPEDWLKEVHNLDYAQKIIDKFENTIK